MLLLVQFIMYIYSHFVVVYIVCFLVSFAASWLTRFSSFFSNSNKRPRSHYKSIALLMWAKQKIINYLSFVKLFKNSVSHATKRRAYGARSVEHFDTPLLVAFVRRWCGCCCCLCWCCCCWCFTLLCMITEMLMRDTDDNDIRVLFRAKPPTSHPPSSIHLKTHTHTHSSFDRHSNHS